MRWNTPTLRARVRQLLLLSALGFGCWKLGAIGCKELGGSVVRQPASVELQHAGPFDEEPLPVVAIKVKFNAIETW